MSAVTADPNCHVCGRELDQLWASAIDTEYGAVAERFSYYLCTACDALSISPLPVDRLSQIYPSTYYSFASGASDGGFVARVKGWLDRRAFARALELIDDQAPRILDVGGGTGEIAAGFVTASDGKARATVVDIDSDSIDRAHARGLDGFVGRIEEFDTDERFDLVLMLNLLEHVADPVAVLRRAHELLSPGGALWLQTPNFRSLDARLFRHRNWGGYHCPRHWVIFSEDGLQRVLGRSGFETSRFERTQGGSFWAASLIGLRRARRGIAAAQAGGGLPKPLMKSPAYMPVAAIGAGFDITTRRLRPVSQVSVMARNRSPTEEKPR